ncbi:LOW QUALITY PROTEIN: hypothetical protein PanWU01x14_025190 [Parasponia andersonii]|uniref:Uncharacterized protein n=1 Tax=Parasponia andersonii TaxID=3476 RepID=A0A2P5DWU3_PARAD|nr:LOW QUALITY PROTEIN: hypothetical protein PanWU01x14_025190 [Parasponia andersonii]
MANPVIVFILRAYFFSERRECALGLFQTNSQLLFLFLRVNHYIVFV